MPVMKRDTILTIEKCSQKPHAAREHHGCMFHGAGVIAYRSFTLRE